MNNLKHHRYPVREREHCAMAKRTCLSVDQVVAALDNTIDEYDGYDEDVEYEFDADEPMMEGSDEEFGEFDDELRDQIEVDEMEDENVVEECVVHMNDGGLMDDSEDMGEEERARDMGGVDERARALPIEWSEDLTPVHIPPFQSPFGPTLQIPDTPVSIFEMFFTSDILEVIVTQSNKYAHQVLGECYSRFRLLVVEELRAYFGFCLLMAINHLPAAEDY